MKIYEIVEKHFSWSSERGLHYIFFCLSQLNLLLYKNIRIGFSVNLNILSDLYINVCIIFNVAILIIQKLENQMELQNSNRLLN